MQRLLCSCILRGALLVLAHDEKEVVKTFQISGGGPLEPEVEQSNRRSIVQPGSVVRRSLVVDHSAQIRVEQPPLQPDDVHTNLPQVERKVSTSVVRNGKGDDKAQVALQQQAPQPDAPLPYLEHKAVVRRSDTVDDRAQILLEQPSPQPDGALPYAVAHEKKVVGTFQISSGGALEQEGVAEHSNRRSIVQRGSVVRRSDIVDDRAQIRLDQPPLQPDDGHTDPPQLERKVVAPVVRSVMPDDRAQIPLEQRPLQPAGVASADDARFVLDMSVQPSLVQRFRQARAELGWLVYFLGGGTIIGVGTALLISPRLQPRSDNASGAQESMMRKQTSNRNGPHTISKTDIRAMKSTRSNAGDAGSSGDARHQRQSS